MLVAKVLPLQWSLLLKKPCCEIVSLLSTVIWAVTSTTLEVNKRNSRLRLSEECMQYQGGRGMNRRFCFNTDIMFLHFRLKHGRNYLSRQSKQSESNPFQIWYRAIMIVFFYIKDVLLRYCFFYVLIHIPKLDEYFSWLVLIFFFRLTVLWISLVAIVAWTTFI